MKKVVGNNLAFGGIEGWRGTDEGDRRIGNGEEGSLDDVEKAGHR